MTTEVVVPARARLAALREAVADFPQVGLETLHHLIGGVYVREVRHPAGVLVVGKEHRKEHLFLLAQGRLSVSGGDEAREIEGPAIFRCEAGSRKAAYALTDCVIYTVHRTDNTEPEAIEAELIASSDEPVLFDFDNQLKRIA